MLALLSYHTLCIIAHTYIYTRKLANVIVEFEIVYKDKFTVNYMKPMYRITRVTV